MAFSTPDILIPFMLTGRLSVRTVPTFMTFPAGSTLIFDLVPPRGMVWIPYTTFIKCRDPVTLDELISPNFTTLTIQSRPISGFPLPAVATFTKPFIESYTAHGQPRLTYIFWNNPQQYTVVNAETYDIQADSLVWLLETTEDIFWTDIYPYMAGMIEFYKGYYKGPKMGPT